MEKKDLKDFIYLDTNYITSILAQIYKGNVLNIADEEEKNKATTDELTESEGGAKFNVLGLIERTFEMDKTTTTNYLSESKKQIINKSIDDYAYDLFLDYLRDNDLLSNDITQDKTYISIKGNFDLFDFSHIENAITIINSLSDNQYMKNSNFQNTNLKAMLEILTATRKIVSVESFIFIENYTIVPKSNYFRYDGLHLNLRYNTKVNILGKIIKRFNANEEADKGIKSLIKSSDFFVPIIKDMIKLPKYNENYYIMPIAIY